MPFVQLTDIAVSFGDRDILNGVNLNLSGDSRVALSGGNGSGKSTFMKVICGLMMPDSGTVSLGGETRVSYLPQSGLVFRTRTLLEEADLAFNFLHKKAEELSALEERLGKTSEASQELPELLEKHHAIHEKLLTSGYYRREEQISQVLTGLGFGMGDLNRKCEEFSGGWQMRIALAKILLESPDILFLDEPTNYLDLEARNWLEDFLKKFPGGLLIVSHDRYFLNVTVNEVIELFNGDLKKYKGNYSSYEKTREAELEILIEQYKRQQEEIEKIEDFINRFRYNASKASMVQSRVKSLEKIQRIEIPESLKKIHFTFPDPPHSGKKVLNLENISKSYGSNRVIENLDFEISRGEKVVITGKNGAGKTTLLKIIAGEDPDFSGEIRYGTGVKTGYFSQDQESYLDKNNSIIEELESCAPTELIPKLRSLLGAFLFRGDDIYKTVNVLSGGERNRLSLLKLLLFPANLLILDEPTNHLDLHSKDILLDAMTSYSGTLIFVSHDRYFIENLATRVLDLGPEGPRDYKGDYSYYLWKTSGEDQEKETESSTVSETEGNSGKLQHENSKQHKNRIRRIKKEEHDIMTELEDLEMEQQYIENEMARPENYSDGEKSRLLKEKLDNNLLKQEETAGKWELLEEELKRMEYFE